MSDPRQHPLAAQAMDELLSQLPTPFPEPTEAQWASQLERAMASIQGARLEAGGGSANHPDRALASDPDEDDILRTPLPVEPGEPEPIDPYGFDAEQEAVYDELRAPLQSGEHAPLRLPTQDCGASEVREARLRVADVRPLRRQPLYWLAGSLGTLAAAAAVVLFVQRARQEPLETALGLAPDGFVAKSELAASNAVPPREPTPAAETPIDDSPHGDVAALPQTKAEIGHVAPIKPSIVAPARVAQMAKGSGPAHAPSPDSNAPITEKEIDLTPAAGPASLDENPAPGAVMAALARTNSDAQRCLSPSLPKVPVRVTFRSDGGVQKVDISKSGVDPSTHRCLERALGTARVAPFARARFAVNTTVSLPNVAAVPSTP